MKTEEILKLLSMQKTKKYIIKTLRKIKIERDKIVRKYGI